MVKREADGEYYLNDVATALLLGISAETLRSHAQTQGGRVAYDLPETVTQSGRRRVKEFGAATGTTEPDMGDALIHFANLEGVELIFEDATGERITLSAPGFWRRNGGAPTN
ncbi:hypothetical protein ACWFOS_13645 [Gordonia terrae]